MRQLLLFNPLILNSIPLVKRAVLESYNPAADTASPVNTQNVSGVQNFWKNLQSYPQDVQRKIYEDMGQIEDPNNVYGGAIGAAGHGLSQGWNTVKDTVSGWGNAIAGGLWGGGKTNVTGDAAGLDAIGEKRDEAKRVYDLALKDPEYMKRLQTVMPEYEKMVKNNPAPGGPQAANQQTNYTPAELRANPNAQRPPSVQRQTNPAITQFNTQPRQAPAPQQPPAAAQRQTNPAITQFNTQPPAQPQYNPAQRGAPALVSDPNFNRTTTTRGLPMYPSTTR